MPVLLRDERPDHPLHLTSAVAPVSLRASWPATQQAPLLTRLRPLITCDVLVRTLRAHGVEVRYMRALPDEGHGQEVVSHHLRDLRMIEPDESVSVPSAPATARVEVELAGSVGSSVTAWRLPIAPLELHHRAGVPALEAWHPEPEVLRFFALTTHYRTPLTLSFDIDARGQLQSAALDDAERGVESIYRTRERLRAIPRGRQVESSEIAEEIGTFRARLDEAMADDLNTPLALSLCAELLKPINDLAERAKSKKAQIGRDAVTAAESSLAHVERMLGLGGGNGSHVLTAMRAHRAAKVGIDEADVSQRIAARVDARSRRDFAHADALRDEIIALGIELVDGPEGTHWRIP